MKAFCSIIILGSLFILGCKPERETSLNLAIHNALSQNVIIVNFSGVSGREDTVIIVLEPMESFEGTRNEDGEYDAYPDIMHRRFPEGNITEIHFNDSIFLKHFNRTWNESDPNPDSTNIYFEDPRSIYNADNYEKSQTSENEYQGIYRITGEDFQYAVDVSE